MHTKTFTGKITWATNMIRGGTIVQFTGTDHDGKTHRGSKLDELLESFLTRQPGSPGKKIRIVVEEVED